MLYGQDVFYFASIRKITAAFGALFTNIVINRFDQPGGQGEKIQSIKVPFAYGPANKWIRAFNESTRQGESLRLKQFLPRMSYELTGMEYDASRKLVTMNRAYGANQNTGLATNLNSFLSQLNPVPYNFGFDVHVTAKSLDDGLQIIEQIMPNFAPTFNITIKEIPELGIVRDVPVIFEGIDTLDDYEGNLLKTRTITWTLHFKIKAYLYPSIKDADIIKEVITNIYRDPQMTEESRTATVTVSVDPIDADPDDDFDVITEIEET